jgi:hypothetical protein
VATLPLRLHSNRRAAGAPLTVILPGETMPGTENGPARGLPAWRGAGCCVAAGHHPPGVTSDGRLAAAVAPGSVRTREGAAFADAPAQTDLHAIGLVVLPVSVLAVPHGQLAPFAQLPG